MHTTGLILISWLAAHYNDKVFHVKFGSVGSVMDFLRKVEKSSKDTLIMPDYANQSSSIKFYRKVFFSFSNIYTYSTLYAKLKSNRFLHYY